MANLLEEYFKAWLRENKEKYITNGPARLAHDAFMEGVDFALVGTMNQPPTSEPPKEPGWILTAMNFIEKDFPLDLEFETDARHIWPKRWERLRRQIECQLVKPEKEPDKEG